MTRKLVTIHSSGQIIFSFPQIEIITLGEVPGRASGMGFDGICEIGDMVSQGLTAGCKK